MTTDTAEKKTIIFSNESPSKKRLKWKRSFVTLLLVSMAAGLFFTVSLMKYSPAHDTEVPSLKLVSQVLYGYSEDAAEAVRNESQIGAFCYVSLESVEETFRLPALACDPQVGESVILLEDPSGNVRLDPQFTSQARNIIFAYMIFSFSLGFIGAAGVLATIPRKPRRPRQVKVIS